MFVNTVFGARSRKKKLLLIAAAIAQKKKLSKRERRLYIRELFSNRAVTGEYFLLPDLENDELYHKKYFRMNKSSFDSLFCKVKPFLDHPVKHAFPIPAKLRLAITLRYLASGTSQAQLAFGYRISPASVSTIIRETMQAIIKVLEPDHLPPPTHAAWLASEKIYREKWDFPFCVGAVDGKHVRLKCPWKSGSVNFNYKGFFSQVLMAVVGGDYRFLLVDIGAPGADCDAGIFGNSKLSENIEKKNVQLPENGKLGQDQDEVPYLLVGDEAFPLKPWLLRPYPGKQLELEKKIFNYRLSRARRIVENAFGIWASRWRILFTPIDGDLDLVYLITRCTIILHNFLRTVADKEVTEDVELPDGDIENGNWRNDINECTGVRDVPRVGSNNYSMNAFNIREVFTKYFSSQQGKLPYQEAYVNRT